MIEDDNTIRLAVDVGGTFTDIALDMGGQDMGGRDRGGRDRGGRDRGGRLISAKVLTTPAAPEDGIVTGIRIACDKAGIDISAIGSFIHGTTLATNALIERKGAATALVTTEGFRDSIEIGYESRFDQYDLQLEKPQPIVPRHRRFTVRERTGARGEVLIPLDEAAVAALAPELERLDIASVAVGLIHSYANPAHEHRIREILRANGVRAEISLSSEVCPEVREYERFMTTVANAYVQPIMARYLRALSGRLEVLGLRGPFYLMTSGGGIATLDAAIRFPIRLVESGPSGGAILAGRVAAEAEAREVVSFDMGGTTAKLCLIDDYEPQTSRSFEIARSARFLKGSGWPVRIPVIEMIEIGAGGGSIAGIDGLGRLQVGPRSAGSVPGPACYAGGGTEATVTDGDLLLGRISAEAFAEGRLKLDVARARAAAAGTVGEALDLDATACASGIVDMVEENMANAARVHAVERGKDLRRRTMIAFGGAGPLHAARLAEKLSIPRVIVPANPSVGSALGFLWAPAAYEVVRSRYMTLKRFDPAGATEVLDALSAEALATVRQAKPGAPVFQYRTAYMRYVGQGHEIEVPLPLRALEPADAALLQESYEALYRQLYGTTGPDVDIEVLSWTALVTTGKQEIAARSGRAAPYEPVPSFHRTAYCPHLRQEIGMPVFRRAELRAGARFRGPALVEEDQTTTFVSALFEGRIDTLGNLVLDECAAA